MVNKTYNSPEYHAQKFRDEFSLYTLSKYGFQCEVNQSQGTVSFSLVGVRCRIIFEGGKPNPKADLDLIADGLEEVVRSDKVILKRSKAGRVSENGFRGYIETALLPTIRAYAARTKNLPST